MAGVNVRLRCIDGDRARFVPLLLEADESEPVLRAYLNDGDLFEAVANGRPAGVVLLTSPDPGTIEIKNIALRHDYRGRGVGRAVMACVAACARARGAGRLLVGTADSSTGTIAFYRACGFHEAGRSKGFFDRYPAPVVEDGVPAHDMVRFEMMLGEWRRP